MLIPVALYDKVNFEQNPDFLAHAYNVGSRMQQHIPVLIDEKRRLARFNEDSKHFRCRAKPS